MDLLDKLIHNLYVYSVIDLTGNAPLFMNLCVQMTDTQYNFLKNENILQIFYSHLFAKCRKVRRRELSKQTVI